MSVEDECGGQVWSKSVEDECECGAEDECGGRVWEMSVEDKCGGQMWMMSVGDECGGRVWRASVSSTVVPHTHPPQSSQQQPWVGRKDGLSQNYTPTRSEYNFGSSHLC